MNNIDYTKRKLTFFFVFIVFLLILALGIGFLSVNFISQKHNDEQNLIHFADLVQTEKIPPQRLSILLENEKPFFGEKRPFIKFRNQQFDKFDTVEYIFTNKKGKITHSNIRRYYRNNDLFYSIAQKRNKTHTYINQGCIVKNVGFSEGDYSFFKKMTYSQLEFIEDIFMFFVLNLLFCIVIYIIGKAVVEKIFIPVEDNMNDMKNFIHNAGHELKTPISVMDSNIQLFQEMKNYDEGMIGEMKKELKNMNSLIDSLIKLSEIGVFGNSEKNSLQDMIQEILKSKKSDIDLQNIIVKNDVSEKIFVQANRDYLHIFLANIIGNAIKYNKKNGRVEITYRKGILKIIDTGIGINSKDQEKIFDRFFQGGISRNNEGFGIGLSLVKKIASIYNWKIQVKSEEGKGSEFEVKF